MTRSSGSALGGPIDLKRFVSILTPTIPQRAAYLAECELSVAAQTFRSYEHRILMDGQFRGCAVTMASGLTRVPLA